MATNKRVRSRRPRTAKDIAIELAGEKQKPRQLERTSCNLREQIHSLECFIAAAPALSRAEKLANFDIVPPMRSAPASKRGKTRLTLQQQMAQRRHRLRLLAEFGILSLTILGLAGWLNHWFKII